MNGSIWWFDVFRCLKTGNTRQWRGSALAVRGGIGTIHGNWNTPIPLDSFPAFESGEVVVDRVFRIGVEMVIRDRDLREDISASWFSFLRLTPTGGTVAAVIPHHLLTLAWGMRTHGRQPFQGVKRFQFLAVF